jgi:heat shock protein HslJ
MRSRASPASAIRSVVVCLGRRPLDQDRSGQLSHAVAVQGKGELVRIKSIAVLGLATAVVSLAAFGGATDAQATPKPTLTGQMWALTKLGPVDRKKAGITARFTADGKVSGFSGCNSYSGTYRTSGGSITVSRKLAVTRKACAGPVVQERLYLAALTAARAYSIAGATLMLRGKSGLALATFAVQSQSLAGTHWVVVDYNNGKQAVVSVLTGTKLTANFDTTGHVTGFAGCNNYNGPVKATPPKISIGPLASTRKFCDAPVGVMEQESAYLAALAGAATYSIQGTTLELRTASGAIAVSLSRSR